MKKVMKKVVAYVLLAAILTGLCPVAVKESKAATKSVALANLGSLGSVSVGSKTKNGNWWMMKIGSKKAFCMNLGYTCHTGDVYRNSSATYSSSDSGKKGKKAYIGYWYAETMNESRKAYVMAQALFWAVEEGDSSEAKLKATISKVKGNTDYFSSKTTNEVYKQIFEKSGSFSINVEEWKYGGSGSHRQELLVIDSGTKVEPHSVSIDDFYRQRIRIRKVDEVGNPMAGAKFTIEAGNIDELYSYKMNGSISDADEDIKDFSVNAQTDANGWINLRLTYRLQTNDYFYLSGADYEAYKKMSSSAQKALKDEWSEMGFKYPSDMTQSSAQELLKKDLENQFNKLSNKYKITETSSGNSNITINPEYKNGKEVTLDYKHSWNRGLLDIAKKDWSQVNEQPYDLEIQDNYKKMALSVKKNDGYSKDKKPHGDAVLDGAVFGIYMDSECTKSPLFYDKNGKLIKGNEFTIQNGSFETGYLRCGQAYYIKELEAPKGYKLKSDVTKITLDGGKYPQDVEYVSAKENVTIENQPILGKVALQKFYSDGQTGQIHPEVGAVFQVYLVDEDGNGSYANANADYERDTLTIDEKGYACTKDLYYGTYMVHQVSSGDKDTERVDDFPVVISNPDVVETKTFSMNNNFFKAYLRVIKKDGNTKKDVLKAGTMYQIYQVDADSKETLITQEYSNGNKRVTVDKFSTDESGQIMTYEPLNSGTYRIYETDAAAGYHISTPYIEVDINSKSDNYTSQTDKDGNTYSVVTVEYTNQEAYGKLSVMKKGEQLTAFKDGKFVYEEKQLDGVILDIYAAEDIATQDNQKTNWFNKGDLVGTITTGESATFTSDCGGITGFETDENGMITVTLPLGKYRVKEKKTLYGYVLPDKEWNIEFNWKNKEDTYVLNSTTETDDKGVMNILNERAKAKIQLEKIDSDSKKGIKDAMFGIYTKDNIYNVKGEIIAEAGTRLGSLITDENGQATTDLDLPLMDEQYGKEQTTVSGAAVSVSGSAVLPENETLNSGNYFLKEEFVSGSYYLDDETEFSIHLEYKNQDTEVIAADVLAENAQTSTIISKTAITNSEELAGCELQITDAEGNVIAKWRTGSAESIVLNDKLETMGYRNVTAVLDEKGAVQINGLIHDITYTLTETRPADGYVTADSISFQLVEGENEQTLVAVFQGLDMTLQTDNIVRMVDDTTKVEISKTEIAGSEEIPGCELEITEKDTDTVIESWTSTEEKHIIEQKLVVGKTYILTEKRPADGYVTADSIEFTIQDSGEIQSVQMKDDTTKVRLIKLAKDTGKKLPGAKFEVYDSKGKKVMSFTSTKSGYDITGKLKVGETYIFKEVKAPKGYELAEPVKYTIKDTGKVQKISVTDSKYGSIRTKTPSSFSEDSRTGSSPMTGYMTLLFKLLSVMLAGSGASIYTWRRYYGKKIRK